MNKETIQKRIKALTDELNRHNYLYYVQDQPEIPDYQFDMLLKELQALEEQHPELQLPDSPNLRVGGAITRKFNTIVHKHPMLSLGNTYSEAELRDFDNRIRKAVSAPFAYVCELKFDGVAIGLTYKKGQLVQAVTRGDGEKGDEVTANVRTIRSIPLQLHQPNLPDEFEARGEIIMPHRSFQELNEARAEAQEALFANPRNAASGSLKLQDSSLVARRRLDCFVYALHGDNLPFSAHYENVQQAALWGFKVSPMTRKCDNIEEVMNYIHQVEQQRPLLPFDIDGVVIKVNEYDIQQELGFTSKFPRWAISYKYKAEQGITILENVTYQVGRTGAVTPVAQLRPVSVAGSMVKRASLYNADKIEELDLHLGDTVAIEKGGEIIPKIVEVHTHSRLLFAEKVQFISHCPECGTALERNTGEAVYYCPNNLSCPPQIQGRIEHFISRRAMNIESMGEGRVEILIANGLVKNIADLYDLKYEQLLGLEKTITDPETGKQKKISFREKTVSNLLSAIENSRDIPFERVLFALGIRHLGETGAKKLALYSQTWDELIALSYEELIQIPEIGERIASSIREYLENTDNQQIISRLRLAGLQFELAAQKLIPRGNSLEGKTFVVSGVFEKYSRDEIKALIELHGGKNVSSISAKTHFVVAGDKMGPEKKKKAEDLNISIISETDLENMIAER